MSFLNALISDLRDRKIWVVAVGLLAAIVAVPVLLSSSSSPAPAHPGPSVNLPMASDTGVPVTVNSSPSVAPLTGKERNPFIQPKLPGAKSATASGSGSSTASGAGTSSSSSTSGSTSGAGTGTGSSGSGSGGSTSSTPTPPPPPPSSGHHTAGPAGLRSTQSYVVDLVQTAPSGGFTSPVLSVRNSVIPVVAGNPETLLAWLGVIQSGKQALFAVLPGTVLSGAGTCIPGLVDCQLLELSPGQDESVATPTTYAEPWTIQVSAISAADHGSASAAASARERTSSYGTAALRASSGLTALSLFQFSPSLGALVDQRNLFVGGN